MPAPSRASPQDSAYRALTLSLLLALLTSFQTHAAEQAVAAPAARADLAFPDQTIDRWNGHVRHRFRFDGRDAWVVVPAAPLPGNPWSWCMMFPDAFVQRCAAPQLVAAGFHHAFLDVGNTFGSPAAVKQLDAFRDDLVRRGLAPRVALIGLSRGGLYAHRYAAEHPEKVAVIYGDGAVCDFKSWPGGKGKGKGSAKDWAACLEAYGFADDAAALAYRGNPVDTLPTLAAAGIALVHVVGDADDVVPPADNADIVIDRYRKLGGTIEVFRKPGGGHHPHGLDDPTPVVEFIVKHAGRPAAPAAMKAAPPAAPGAAPQAEPTNAAETAATKAAQEAVVNEKYAALVAGLPPEEQAWERVLQEQLGSFYLPLHKADKVAGRSNAWDFVTDDPALPRVLLIGDSVSRGYTQAARKALAGKANVHRAPANCGPTASGIKNLDVWLGDGRWDLIHFNFGIHDRNTPVADYVERLETLVERMQKTDARLVWATTTPIPDVAKSGQTAASIVERNSAAAAVMEQHGVAVDDLFSFITPHLAEVQPPHDVHFTGKGYDLLGGKVAESIRENLGRDLGGAGIPKADSAAAWKARGPDIRRRMQQVMGPLPGPADTARRTPPAFETLAEERGDGHVRRKLRYRVDDGDLVPAWLLVPDAARPTKESAAMLCLHQTNSVGKDEPAGLGGLPGLHYARELATRGYVCLVPDYPRFGEYRWDADLASTGYASGSMKAVWNNIRGVDLLASLPLVDPERIGVIGHSLGGHNAIFTAAFDERLRAVVTSCGFTPFPDYYGGDLAGWTSRTYMPRIRDTYGGDPKRVPFDFPEVVASLAPRGFFANAPVNDGNFAVAGVRRTFAEVAPIYARFAADDRLVLATPDAGHEFPQREREQAYAWLDRTLAPATATPRP